MPTLETMQCPACGSPVEVEPGRRRATCGYCGSALRLSRDASGELLAALDDLQADTQLLATRAAIEHLEGQLDHLGRERSALLAEHKRALARARLAGQPVHPTLAILAYVLFLTVGFGLLLALTMLLLMGDRSGPAAVLRAGCNCFPLLLVGLGVAWTVHRWGSAERRLRAQAEATSYRELAAAREAKIARATEEIEACRARIEELRAELDRLAGEI